MAQAFPILAQDIETPTRSSKEWNSRATYGLASRALGALGLAGLWGVAAGSAKPLMALFNIYKVPMVLALALAVALPAVFVTRHFLSTQIAPLQLLNALVRSVYRATLVLAGFAPLVMVYAYTSESVAPLLAQGSALAAMVGGTVALTAELSRIEGPRIDRIVLGTVTIVTFGLALLQLISLATPVLTLPTVFGGGIDGVLR
ncbi:MAG: hypothetical protein ACOY0T_30900 [Myxococcota bacterium]